MKKNLQPYASLRVVFFSLALAYGSLAHIA